MYQVEESTALLRARRRLVAARRDGRPLVARTVVLLGATSLVTDISSEMVAAVLPLYLVSVRGLNPLQFGLVDGIYQGGSALVRIVFGFVADRMRRYRAVAAVGYGLSAASKLGLLLAGSVWGAISGIVLMDRIGKGIRTAPRDAMISLSSPRESLGTAFGVHRAMDTCGAMLGPLFAFGLLSLSGDHFADVFLVSLCFAVVGVAILVLLVRDPARERGATVPAAPPTLRGAGALLATPRFGALVLAATLLGLATVSDAFLYLRLQDSLDFDPSLFPLLYVGTALVYMTLALPAGRLADRVGRLPVFVGGYAVQLGLYVALLAGPSSAAFLPFALVALGLRYAATDGVLAALGSAAVPEALRGTGLAVLGTATGLAQFGASVAFGALWTLRGPDVALTWFTVALAACLAASAAGLVRGEERRGVTQRRRIQAFAAVTGAALVLVVVVVASAALSSSEEPAAPSVTMSVAAGDLLAVDRDRRRGRAYGRLFLVPAAAPGAVRRVTGMACERVDFSGGSGICLTLRRRFPTRAYAARLFDARGRVRGTVGLQGFPSRARVSPGGRYATSTSFVSGDSYTSPGAFSTRAVIYDARRGRRITDLEQFTILRDGKRVRRPDFNFWGVTFEGDTGRFYATLATGSHHYLVRGDVATRTAEVVRDGVECPSLSPDRRRIAFKARVGDPFQWRIHVLDLRTGRETPLPETRSVDDQVEWLDEETLAYDVDETVVSVRADGSAPPRLLMSAATSPSVVR